ncbi:MAG: hypothetical protein ACT4PI_19065 [Actinomycetota bacterium]
MARRDRHPKKEVEAALQYAEAREWAVEQLKARRGHAWGVAKCARTCIVWINSTPRNPGTHAKKIVRAVGRCPH